MIFEGLNEIAPFPFETKSFFVYPLYPILPNTSVNVPRLHHAQDFGMSKGISSSMHFMLPSANFS